ncbi:fluoride efflux transporter CrcB [Pyrodictium occultum]|uniref:fluoride efflux transporter CrcB n=1 Tax=Pyrodictium occultum TaxID=2309 RepID=UPI00191C1997|nr:fluoride efflux transporter CrcB [Pyrodictium occultum]
MLRETLLVALGGALGAVARWLFSKAIQAGHEFPVGTLAVNVLGSILLGFVLEASLLYGVFTRDQRLLIATGFAGAFTTFSTFMYESFSLVREHEGLQALAYVALSLGLGLAGIYLGAVLANMVYGRGTLATP